MLGFGGRTESGSLERLSELRGVRGVRLGLNKRLKAERTMAELGWAPKRLAVLADVGFGSYAGPASRSFEPPPPSALPSMGSRRRRRCFASRVPGGRRPLQEIAVGP
jgi:hypothetical protein